MKPVEENALLDAAKQLDPEVLDLSDAITVAIATVPLVKFDTWFGEFGNGTYYGDSKESRYFMGLTPQEAAEVLAKELY